MAKPKSVPIGPLVGGVGAILLLVSLFLDWYEDVTGFTVFEAEWWHFDYDAWREFPIGTATFEEIEGAGRPGGGR